MGSLAISLLGIMEFIGRKRSARLDRTLCNDECRRLYPSAAVNHLTYSHSDHSLILLRLDGTKSGRLGERSFKFQATWMLHAEFFKWMENEWAWNRGFVSSLRNFIEKIQAWNRDTFRNIFRWKKRIHLRLEGYQGH